MALKRTLSKSTIGIDITDYERSKKALNYLESRSISVVPSVVQFDETDTTRSCKGYCISIKGRIQRSENKLSPIQYGRIRGPSKLPDLPRTNLRNRNRCSTGSISKKNTGSTSTSPPPVIYSTSTSNEDNSKPLTYTLNPLMESNRSKLSPLGFYLITLQYIEENCQYCSKVMGITFGQLSRILTSTSLQYFQHLVETKLGIPWDDAGNIIKSISKFIFDKDIEDATIAEVTMFLQNACLSLQFSNAVDVLDDDFYFFQETLERFKHFLIELWLKLKKINFPCEFGAKSDTLFLCMECHREHR